MSANSSCNDFQPSHFITSQLNIDGDPCRARVLLLNETKTSSKEVFWFKMLSAEIKRAPFLTRSETITNEVFIDVFGESTSIKLSFTVPTVSKTTRLAVIALVRSAVEDEKLALRFLSLGIGSSVSKDLLKRRYSAFHAATRTDQHDTS